MVYIPESEDLAHKLRGQFRGVFKTGKLKKPTWVINYRGGKTDLLYEAELYLYTMVNKHWPRLVITSAYRRGAGQHGKGCAIDVAGPLPEMYNLFETVIHAGLPGGVGIGLPPAALHVHLDLREAMGNGLRAYWIETDKPDPKTGAVPCIVRPTNPFQTTESRWVIWNKYVERVRKSYDALPSRIKP